MENSIIVSKKKYFTFEEASSSIPFVRRIMRDIVFNKRNFSIIQGKINYPKSNESVGNLEFRRGQIIEKLDLYIDELLSTGIKLNDIYTGTVDFPSIHPRGDREIYLVWNYNQREIKFWRETNSERDSRHNVSILENTR